MAEFPDLTERPPWRPPGLPDTERSRWALRAAISQVEADGSPSYLVVDEIIDGRAVLHVTPWPVVDPRGRLRFPRLQEGFVVGTDVSLFAMRVRRPSGTPERPLRTGDVFAATVRPAARLTEASDLLDLLTSPPVDISADAREAAKRQYFAAVTGVYSEDEFADLYRDSLVDGEDDGDAVSEG